MKIWDRSVTSGISQWSNYVNNEESIFLAIQRQVEPSLWDKTKDDPRFAAIQALKYPIELIKLMKERCTEAATGVWAPLTFVKQMDKLFPIHKALPRKARLWLLVTTSAQWNYMLLQPAG